MNSRVVLARVLTSLFLMSAASLAAAGAIDMVGYKTNSPANWTQQQPETNMRVAQFAVPAARGKEGAQSIVFYFGKAGGGPVEANIPLWESDFAGPGGKPVKARITKGKVGGMTVTWAEMNGSYARGMRSTGAQSTAAKPNQTLLVAVVETPKGNLTFHLFGPQETVAAQRKAFEGMVNGLK